MSPFGISVINLTGPKTNCSVTPAMQDHAPTGTMATLEAALVAIVVPIERLHSSSIAA